MNPSSSGLRSGLMLMVIGAFLLLRTVTKDSTGRTLIDHILGKAATTTPAAAAPARPSTPAASPAPARVGPTAAGQAKAAVSGAAGVAKAAGTNLAGGF